MCLARNSHGVHLFLLFPCIKPFFLHPLTKCQACLENLTCLEAGAASMSANRMSHWYGRAEKPQQSVHSTLSHVAFTGLETSVLL